MEVPDLTERGLLTEKLDRSEMRFRDLCHCSHADGHKVWLYSPGSKLAAIGCHASMGFVVILNYMLGAPLLGASPIMSEVLTTGITLNFLGIGVCASARLALNQDCVNK
jgi:hypothetical protein